VLPLAASVQSNRERSLEKQILNIESRRGVIEYQSNAFCLFKTD